MGIDRSRNPYSPWGDKYDAKIADLFRKGYSIKKISNTLKLNSPVGVAYRLKRHIYPIHAFKLKYFSKFADKWRTTTKAYSTFRETRAKKARIRKCMGKNVKIKIIPVLQKVKTKNRWNESLAMEFSGDKVALQN